MEIEYQTAMNWPALNEIYRKAISKEMTAKEASNEISQIWYLLKFHSIWRDHYINHSGPCECIIFSNLNKIRHTEEWYNVEHEGLLDLTIALAKVADDNWQQRWADSIPTDMKAVEQLKKILQERGIKTS